MNEQSYYGHTNPIGQQNAVRDFLAFGESVQKLRAEQDRQYSEWVRKQNKKVKSK